MNTKALENDIIAEIFPLENAVNNPEAYIFSPVNMKAIEKILRPFKARLYTLLELATKDVTIYGANVKQRIKIIIEDIKINLLEYKLNSFNFSLFCAP